MRRIPVILDTDPGSDIDDTWALLYLLRCPELDLKLVTTATSDTTYRARLTARLLELEGRSDVAVGIGVPVVPQDLTLVPWAEGYDLGRYPGRIHENGVDALVRTIMDSPEPITVIAIAPLPNIGAALALEPRIAAKARFVGMQGAVDLGYNGSTTVVPEWNVRGDVPAAQRTFAASWPMTITPLDTCGLVRLVGAEYKCLEAAAAAGDRGLAALFECYRIWREFAAAKAGKPLASAAAPVDGSSTLFDCVAVYLAFCENWLRMETVNLAVSDDGLTRRDPTGQPVRCAMAWTDQKAFHNHLVQRLLRQA